VPVTFDKLEISTSHRCSEYPHLNNMAYSQKTIDAIMRAPKTPGNQLGRWAVHLNFSVVRIAKALGVSRQTVYNWFEGGEIFVAYEHRVETMLTYLKNSKTADEAWRKICQHYGLAP